MNWNGSKSFPLIIPSAKTHRRPILMFHFLVSVNLGFQNDSDRR